MRKLSAHRLGRVPYAEAHALQEQLVEARKAGSLGDTLLLLEHPKVITMGRRAKGENVLLSGDALRAGGYELFETGRGGDVTFHGPGQLVVYPIVDLKPDRIDVRRYVRDLEETMIRVCADYGLSAERSDGFNGTWIENRKVGAVGVRISQWVTMHGFALNVSTELAAFSAIVPCGISDRGVTSLSRELGRSVELPEAEERAARHFAQLFEAELSFHDGPPEL
jgi:lipoyl(octanoyl) transferase